MNSSKVKQILHIILNFDSLETNKTKTGSSTMLQTFKFRSPKYTGCDDRNPMACPQYINLKPAHLPLTKTHPLSNLTLIVVGLIVGLLAQLSRQQSSISLNNADWLVRNSNSSLVLQARVPGGIYSDPRRTYNILKQDILVAKNDLAYRWVGN